MYLAVRHRDISFNNSVFTSTAVDQETAEADEGIGESETDVASSVDADASCPSYCKHFSSATSSPPTHDDVSQHSEQCDKQTPKSHTCETNAVLADNTLPDDNKTEEHLTNMSADDESCLTDVMKAECSLESHDCDPSQFSNVPKSASSNVDEEPFLADTVEMAVSEDSGSSQTYDVLKSEMTNDDDPALSEDSGSSQTLSVTQSLSLNDDDQGSLTDVTETAHSEDSGSSRTVEVGDDDIPQLLDEEEEVDTTESLIPDPAEPGYPAASSHSSEVNTGNTTWTAEEASDSAKDVTVTKESGENWDDDPLIALRTDEDEEAACKYNYCFVQRSPFPLGYERSKTVVS